jgi:phage terminase small subunit
MAQRKRVQTSTAAGALETFRHVAAKLQSPIQLDPDEQINFDRVISCRETASWDSNHLLLASHLAITYCQLDEANLSIAKDGLMVRNDRGTKVVNPAITAKSSLSATILQLNRVLGLTATSQGVAGAPQAKRNAADAKAREIIQRASEDDLLA